MSCDELAYAEGARYTDLAPVKLRLSDRERNARARRAPVDVEHAALRRVFDADGEPLVCLRRLAHRHRHAAQFVLLTRIWDAPALLALVDDQVPGAAHRDRVQAVAAGRHRDVAELQRAV